MFWIDLYIYIYIYRSKQGLSGVTAVWADQAFHSISTHYILLFFSVTRFFFFFIFSSLVFAFIFFITRFCFHFFLTRFCFSFFSYSFLLSFFHMYLLFLSLLVTIGITSTSN